jgi:hypothetical protein
MMFVYILFSCCKPLLESDPDRMPIEKDDGVFLSAKHGEGGFGPTVCLMPWCTASTHMHWDSTPGLTYLLLTYATGDRK